MTSDKQFQVKVEGVGPFTFRKRTLALQVALEAEAQRMVGGICLDPGLVGAANEIATIQTLMLQGPPGFSLDDMDPLDLEAQATLHQIYEALRVAEEEFRARLKAKRAAVGEAA